MKRRLTIAGVVVAVVIAATWLSFAWQTHRTRYDYTGTVETREIQIGSRIGGRVAAVPIEEGGVVAAGVTLVRFECDELKAQRIQAEASLEQARADLDKMLHGNRPYNPSPRSANFFVPGLIAILLQVMAILMIALSLVRERERGTLEQLTMTPVAPLGLMVGKIIPYGVLTFSELCIILFIMRTVFLVPIHGDVFLLLLLSIPFLLTVLGISLVISTRARTQAEAFQLSMGTILPSVFLSGYIFLIENMPIFFQGISRLIPATYYIQILRCIILRGAGIGELLGSAAVLIVMGCGSTLLAARLFVKQGAL